MTHWQRHILPVLQITLNTAMAVQWFIQGDWRKTLYWLAAAVIAVVVNY